MTEARIGIVHDKSSAIMAQGRRAHLVRETTGPVARCAGTGLYRGCAPIEPGLRPILALPGNDPCR